MKKTYVNPVMEVINVRVEKGFATSGNVETESSVGVDEVEDFGQGW